VNRVTMADFNANQDHKVGLEDSEVAGNVLANDGSKNTSVDHFTVGNDAAEYSALPLQDYKLYSIEILYFTVLLFLLYFCFFFFLNEALVSIRYFQKSFQPQTFKQ